MSAYTLHNFMHKLSIFLCNKLRVLRQKLSLPIKTLTPNLLCFSRLFVCLISTTSSSSSFLIISDAAISRSSSPPSSLSASQPHN